MPFVVALLTPFDPRGRVDLARLRAHTLWLQTQGADGFASTGWSGEFLYLSDREREAIHRTVLESAMGKPVFPCTWDPSLSTATFLTEAALQQGAKGVLMPPPLLYDLDDDAIMRWYESLAKAGPVLAYHHPRAGTPVTLGLAARLLEAGLVQGIVDQSGDPWRVARLVQAHPGRVWSASDAVLSRARTMPDIAGHISEVANIWPSFARRVWDGEDHLDATLLERVVGLESAGGLRAMKSLAGFGCRPPLVAPPDDHLMDLAPAESPSRR